MRDVVDEWVGRGPRFSMLPDRTTHRLEYVEGMDLNGAFRWTDYSTSPPSQVVLKVQQDATGRAYRVKLDLQAVP